MKPWLRLTLITVAVGGGFTGFAATLQQLLKPQNQQPAYFVLVFGFLSLYAFVTFSGLLLVLNERQTSPLLVAFALQIPWVSSPLLAFRFTAGFHVTVGLLGGTFSGGFSLGSEWQCNLFQKLPWGIGVNLFAVLIVIILIYPKASRLLPRKGVAH